MLDQVERSRLKNIVKHFLLKATRITVKDYQGWCKTDLFQIEADSFK